VEHAFHDGTYAEKCETLNHAKWKAGTGAVC
jgi:hypothetical protein